MREPFAKFVEQEIVGDPVMIACGLPATNKTETMEVVERLKGFKILRTDMIRRQVLSEAEIFDEKQAANMDKRKMVYDEMFRQASAAAAAGQGIILDATFVTQALRKRAAEVAARNGKHFVIQQTHCTEAYSLDKISKRSKENYESNALSPVAYHNNVKKFEPVDLDDLKATFPDLKITHLLVDTNSDDEQDWFVIERIDRQ